MTAQFHLSFVRGKQIELIETFFKLHADSPAYRCVRGRTSGAFAGCGTFLWSQAVQAMCLLVVRAKLCSTAVGHERAGLPILQGTRGSAASSFDMSISAQTNWLAEMFGVSLSGGLVAKRLFVRSNSSLKLPGPVSVGINSHLIEAAQIRVAINGQAASEADLVRTERLWTKRFRGDSALDSVPQVAREAA
jgi:hypothetical protein